VSKTIELSLNPTIVAHTADGSPIRAMISNIDVVINKNGTLKFIPRPKQGCYITAKETSTDNFIIIKNENGKISTYTTDIEPPAETGTISSLKDKPQPQSNKHVEPTYKDKVSSTSTKTKKPDTTNLPPIPKGFRMYTEGTPYMGKPTIINSNFEIMYLSNGIWKKTKQ